MITIIGYSAQEPTRSSCGSFLRVAVLTAACWAGTLLAEEPPPAQEQPRISVDRNVVFATYAAAETAEGEASGNRERGLRADVYLPAGAGPHPAVLLIHGGGWTTGSKLQMGSHGRRLANHGFVAVAIDYRLAPQYPFPAQVEDCWKALRWMAADREYEIDARRIGVAGYSAGGHLACLLATTDSSEWGFDETIPRVCAVVAGGAPCNFEILPPDKSILAHWLGGTRNEVPHLYRQASPIRAVSKDDPPAFFYHGSDDQVVPAHVSRQMADRLEQVGVPIEYYLCEQKGHVSAFFDVEAGNRSIAFLGRVMGSEAIAHRNAETR